MKGKNNSLKIYVKNKIEPKQKELIKCSSEKLIKNDSKYNNLYLKMSNNNLFDIQNLLNKNKSKTSRNKNKSLSNNNNNFSKGGSILNVSPFL